MRPERLYLLDMVEAADNVVIHISGQERDSFLVNVTARAAWRPARASRRVEK